jgi:nitrate/nitrite transporter NarK
VQRTRNLYIAGVPPNAAAAMGETTARTARPGETGPHWQRTLWTMVGVQFVMSISFSITSPIMPLFLPQLGVHSMQSIDLWAGAIASITSFIGIFTAPIWGSMADRYGRKLMVCALPSALRSSPR